MKTFYIYILSNKPNGTLYIGMTSNIKKRIYQHKTQYYKGFTSRYDIKMLVYYEIHHEFYSAMKREKQLKAWERKWKIELIKSINPKWTDLFELLV